MIMLNNKLEGAGAFLVSVVIPCFNRSDVIGRSISSALGQSHENLEVIVVDDCSTDSAELMSVIGDFNDERLKLVVHDCNRGGGAARNSGVREAKGDYIAFLDSDDEWLPEKLEKQLELMNPTGDDVAQLVYTLSTVVTTEGGVEKRGCMPDRALQEGESVGDYLFLNRGFIPTSSMLLPRRLALEVPFNEEISRHQDYDFLLRIERHGCRFYLLDEPLVIIHWEDLHQSNRGLDPSRSLAFLKEYSSFLSPKARSGFANQQVVGRLLRDGQKVKALNILFQHVRLWHLSLAQLVCLFSGIIFGDFRIAESLAALKHRVTALKGGSAKRKKSN